MGVKKAFVFQGCKLQEINALRETGLPRISRHPTRGDITLYHSLSPQDSAVKDVRIDSSAINYHRREKTRYTIITTQFVSSEAKSTVQRMRWMSPILYYAFRVSCAMTHIAKQYRDSSSKSITTRFRNMLSFLSLQSAQLAIKCTTKRCQSISSTRHEC